ncbi:MAG: tRNA dihydrouridine(20/20a) synthase DusA [Arenimonas sp.]
MRSPPESELKRANGRYVASARLSVAPMMDWTDTHCRAFHRILAPHARLYTEMVHAQAVIHGDRDRLLGFDQSEHPLALQLGGSDPAHLAEASRIAEQWGYDEINLNVGCPSDRVQAGRFGACLMKEPGLVADCIAAMIAAVKIPVTVKCRLGVDELETYEHFLGFVDTVSQAGCHFFVVHARKAWLSGLSPKENREIPPLRYEWVYDLKKQRPDLSIVLNGGLSTVEASLEVLPHVDGVMIGRMAYHEPYRLHQLDCAVYTPGAAVETRENLLLKYREYVEQQCARGIAVKHITRHILGMFHAQAGGRMFRQVLSEKAYKSQGWEIIEEAMQATRL